MWTLKVFFCHSFFFWFELNRVYKTQNTTTTILVKERKHSKKTIKMSTNFQFINLDYLDLMSDGDEDMKQTMIEMLLEEIPEEMDKMRTYNEEGNWKELREVSHKMKSTLSFIGNAEMTTANQQVEDIAKVGQGTEAIPALLAILFDIYPKALDELKVVGAAI